MFYNTGIATYIWVLSNRKPAHRQGRVQLIDATGWYTPLRKNLGQKNCELSEEDIQRIVDAFLAFEESEQSKIFPNQAFGYWKITVERPLRLRVDLSEPARARLRGACGAAGDSALADLVDQVAESTGAGPFMDYNIFLDAVSAWARYADQRMTKSRERLLRDTVTTKDETAQQVLKNIYKPGKVEANPLYGRYAVQVDGKPRVVEYEPDSDLRDTEQIPLLEEGGIEAFFRREVLPYVPDAWIDESKTRVGYEISFNRYFYKPEPLRTLAEIRADIQALERETDGLLDEILVDVRGAP
jgi:type I restriction enzyme M protein